MSHQSELLCTLGLGYLLQDDRASRAFGDLLGERSGVALPHGLAWHAEQIQADGGRPDLEGHDGNGNPMVKVEAKLTAAFGDGQLLSYSDSFALRDPSTEAVLAILVPSDRVTSVSRAVVRDLAVTSSGPPWRVGDPGVAISVVSWEEALDDIASVVDGPLLCDVDQLYGMYLALAGIAIAPFTEADLRLWRGREADLKEIVDRVTRKLTSEHAVYPMREWTTGYLARYVCTRIGETEICFSIGLREPLPPHATPVWMRYHSDTDGLEAIRRRLEASRFSLAEDDGHLWLPLDVPTDVEGDEIVDGLVEQADVVRRAATG